MVVKYLNEDELFKVAMEIEKQGIEFYTKAFENASVEKAKDIFKFLSDQEKHHFQIFKRMDLEIKQIRFRPESFDEEISAYLGSLVDSGIFENLLPKEKWQDITDREAVSIGIQVEKSSILFYSSILSITEEASAPEALNKIIREEKSHLVMLTEIWKDMNR